MSLPVIYELFESIVGDVSAAMGTTVHFRHGHMLEVVKQVKDMMVDHDIDKRYPLIALRHDIKQNPINGGVEIDCRLYIVTLSDPKYTAEERYDNIFVPYLRPILEEFIYQLANSGYFEESTTDQVYDKLTFWERLFWGNELVMGNDGNIFADWVDCIELEFSGLTAFTSCELRPIIPYIVDVFTDVTGNYAYILHSIAMGDPAAFKSDYNFVIGTGSNTPDSIEQVSPTLYIADITGANIQAGDTIVFHFTTGNVASAAGELLPTYTAFAVTNTTM